MLYKGLVFIKNKLQYWSRKTIWITNNDYKNSRFHKSCTPFFINLSSNKMQLLPYGCIYSHNHEKTQPFIYYINTTMFCKICCHCKMESNTKKIMLKKYFTCHYNNNHRWNPHLFKYAMLLDWLWEIGPA